MKHLVAFLLMLMPSALFADSLTDTRQLMASTVTTKSVSNAYLSGARDKEAAFVRVLATYRKLHPDPVVVPVPVPTPPPVPTPTPVPATWTACATEGQTCTFTGRAIVRYGSADKFATKVAEGSIECSNRVFGDPAQGVVKSCSYQPSTLPVDVVPAPLPAPTPTPTPTPPPAPPTDAKGKLGIIAPGSVYYGTERLFANLAYASGAWRDPDAGWGNMAPEKIDAAGYPKSGGVIFLVVPQSVRSGIDTPIKCTWTGSGALRVDGDRSGEVYGSNTFTVTWKAANPSAATLYIGVNSIDPANPLRNLDCREAAGVAASGKFLASYIDDLKPFNVLRFLDQSSANGNPPLVTWATRTTPEMLTQNGTDGMALENMIDQANLAGSDPWFTVPWNADADYIQRMGQLIHDRMSPDHRAYIELSNEVWNFQFGQTSQALNEGLAENLSPDKYTNQLLRLAEKTIWMNKILTPIFADKPSRLVRVIAAQHANDWAGRQIFGFRDIAKWVDAFATGAYFGHSFFDGANANVTDLPTLFASLETMRKETIAQAVMNRKTAEAAGVRYIIYESGQHILPTDPDRDGPILASMQRSPLMYTTYQRFIADITKVADQVEIYAFGGQISKYGAWGIREYAGQPLSETPKRRAVLEYIAAPSR